MLHILQDNSTKKYYALQILAYIFIYYNVKMVPFTQLFYHISSNQLLIKNFKILKSPNHVHKIIKKKHTQKNNINGMKTSHVKK